MDNKIIPLDNQVKGMPKDELKDFIKEKYNHYKSSPQGCIDYIQECLYVAKPGVGYEPLQLWDTQKKLIYDIVECMFDPVKNMYILLGSRQCGKTTCLTVISDWLTTFYTKYNVVLIHTDDKRGKNTCEEFRSLRNLKSKLMYYKPKKNALTHQIFANDSSFQLQSAQKSKSKEDIDTGRGLSVNLLWIDEAGTVDVERLESSVFPTTSTTFIFCGQNHIPFIILLSGTANGRVGIGKRFYDLWKKVEPPLNKTNKYMGGYLLHWRDIPIKTQEWYESWKETMTERKIHQEFDCVFYGTETSLFTDSQIVNIQNRSNLLKIIEPNYRYVTPSGYIAKGVFYKEIKKNNNYLFGIDMSKGRGQDSTVIEVFDHNTLEQIFEFKDNSIQHDDFVKTLNNIALTFISNGANICISIEDNMTGTAVINDLISLNSIYKMLIYRDTISVDTSKNKNISTLIPYHDCKYGVNISKGNRDLLIDLIFKYIDKNIDNIQSKELLFEIESLEIDKNGKIEGNPHDDTVFALGHILLLKYRGRVSNIMSIFNYCNDIRNDSELNKQMNLYLSNKYNDDDIQKMIENDTSSNQIHINTVGLMDTVASLNSSSSNVDESAIINNAMTMNLLNGNYSLDYNNDGANINMNNIHQLLMQQMQIIKNNHPPSNMRAKNNNNDINSFIKSIGKKKKTKKNSEEDLWSDDDITSSQIDPASSWLSMIVG